MVRLALLFGLALAAAGWLLSAPATLNLTDIPDHTPDPLAGQRVFWAGGCASCHATPINGDRPQGDLRLQLGGGLELHTPYGIFRAPNISTHPEDGIGAWTDLDFVNAMQRGVAPDGSHYYPVFPFASYAKMPAADVLDLKAYMDTLPPVAGTIEDHSLSFPWQIRRGIGLWKRRYLDSAPIVSVPTDDPVLVRGRQLVEGAGHCGECHTSRDAMGGLMTDYWLAGAPNPEGRGSIPNITPASSSVGDWTVDDLSYYLESGFTPDFDTAGGTMVAVQENMAELTPEDRRAIATYLKHITPLERPD